MYKSGPNVVGNFSAEGNQEIIQDYLDTIDDEVVVDSIKIA